MEIFSDKRLIPYKVEQMFDMISDVERYEEFLPGWHNTRILKRDKNIAYVEQSVGLGVFHIRYCTQAVFTRPMRIDITSTDGPFRLLKIRWDFEPVNCTSCLIHFYIDFELRSIFLKRLIAPLFTAHCRRIISAFEERANLIYSE